MLPISREPVSAVIDADGVTGNLGEISSMVSELEDFERHSVAETGATRGALSNDHSLADQQAPTVAGVLGQVSNGRADELAAIDLPEISTLETQFLFSAAQSPKPAATVTLNLAGETDASAEPLAMASSQAATVVTGRGVGEIADAYSGGQFGGREAAPVKQRAKSIAASPSVTTTAGLGGGAAAGWVGGGVEGPSKDRSLKEYPGRGRRPHHPSLPSQSSESYAPIKDNDFKAIVNPGDERSTFSTDVDTASYANVRRFLSKVQRPPRDAVRVEEMINYFDYAYPNPAEEKPFTMNLEVNEAPWKPGHRLLRVGLKARDVMVDRRPDSNLVFLVDVSGSMSPYDKLPLLKQSLTSLVRGLSERDFVSLVTYSGQSRVLLEPTNGSDKTRILGAIDELQAGGSTNGESGIRLAYELAKKHAKVNGSNRVLLATDGDFNVGVTSTPQLIEMAKKRAKEDHIFLTVLGFGEDNLQDDRMEQLANQVDGAYHYIDSEQEGRKVLIEEMSATLVTVAKDVKLQVEFNPAKVKQYRLIGYANRLLQNRDFRDDNKDAGEMGAGHRVTAFYEIVPVGQPGIDASEAPLKYRPAQPEPVVPKPEMVASDELVTVRVSYKEPKGTTSKQLEFALTDDGAKWNDASEDFRFAASVAAFGMRLRESSHWPEGKHASNRSLGGCRKNT